MIRAGIASVTFRALHRSHVVQLAREAKLEGIEWGADVHVPPGDVLAAREASTLTQDAGLEVAAYGSYYRLGARPLGDVEFEAVLVTAVEMGAPLIRVWAGNIGSSRADAGLLETVTEDLQRVADLSARAGIRLGVEFHGNTLNDCGDSGARLLGGIRGSNASSLWQPKPELSVEENLSDLGRLRPFLSNLHVFHWWPTFETRLSLSEGETGWRRYLAAVDRYPRWALLEFVPNDNPAALRPDAAALRAWIADLEFRQAPGY